MIPLLPCLGGGGRAVKTPLSLGELRVVLPVAVLQSLPLLSPFPAHVFSLFSLALHFSASGSSVIPSSPLSLSLRLRPTSAPLAAIGPPKPASCCPANTSDIVVDPVKGSDGPSVSDATETKGRRGVRDREAFSLGRRRSNREERDREDCERGGAAGTGGASSGLEDASWDRAD